MERRIFSNDDVSAKTRSVNVFNGPKGVVFRAQFQKSTDEGPEKFPGLELWGLGVGKPISATRRLATAWQYWSGFAEWLPSILDKWKWELETVEDVAGQPCARLAATRDDSPFTDVLWLDLEHDCLVRRHRYRKLSGIWDTEADEIVDEFQRLEGGIWFPKRGRSQLAGTPHENHLFVVTEAAVNVSLDLARFEPPTPREGTVVIDNIGYFKRQAGQGLGMNPPGFFCRPGDTADAALARMRAAARQPTPEWVWWSGAFASASLAFLIAGFWLSRRKERRLGHILLLRRRLQLDLYIAEPRLRHLRRSGLL